jgi:hypothetical protein
MRVAQVTGRGLGLQAFEILQIAGGANEQAQIGPLLGQNAGHMRAEESGCACDESSHAGNSQLAVGS